MCVSVSMHGKESGVSQLLIVVDMADMYCVGLNGSMVTVYMYVAYI